MDYTKQKTPPVREDRLAACQAYGGSCGALSGKKGCLYGAKRTFSQTQGCQLTLSLAILNTIRDAVLIVHGPLGCGGNLLALSGVSKNFQKLREASAAGLRWINTNLTESDVIKGGEEKLKKAILHADREFRPSAIIILNSCVPALIGDDLDGLLDEVQKQTAAKLVPIHCEGFKTKIQATAYDAVYHGILRTLVEDDREAEQPVYRDELAEVQDKYRLSRTVNLLNVSSMSRQDEEELVRLLKGLGLEVRIYPCYSHVEDFKLASEAALNVSICATHDDYFVEHMKEKYGTPYILRTIPIGIANTNKWLRDIAGFFGIEETAERLIDSEVSELERVLSPYRQALQGKTALVAGGEIRILTTAELLNNLGIKILGLRGYHYDKFGEDLLDEILTEIPDSNEAVINIGTAQPFEQANLINALQPDLFVGHVGLNGWAAKQGIPVLPIFQQTHNYMGYLGVFEVAKRLTRKFKNPGFNKNLGQNVKLPYFEEWYVQSPFRYIDDNLAL